jgi:hypothetical protein
MTPDLRAAAAQAELDHANAVQAFGQALWGIHLAQVEYDQALYTFHKVSTTRRGVEVAIHKAGLAFRRVGAADKRAAAALSAANRHLPSEELAAAESTAQAKRRDLYAQHVTAHALRAKAGGV